MGYAGKIRIAGVDHLIASTMYGVCTTTGATAAKIVTVSDFTNLFTGVVVFVKFTYANAVADPTLNVNGTGAYPIYISGTNPPGLNAEESWRSNSIVGFLFDGTAWLVVNNENVDDGAIVTAKLADDAVTTAKIADANVTTGKLADNAVTYGKLDETLQYTVQHKVLYLTDIACTATTGDFASVSNDKITADHVVAECVFANPSYITTDVTWTTGAETLVLNGTCDKATTVNIVLVKKDN